MASYKWTAPLVCPYYFRGSNSCCGKPKGEYDEFCHDCQIFVNLRKDRADRNICGFQHKGVFVCNKPRASLYDFFCNTHLTYGASGVKKRKVESISFSQPEKQIRYYDPQPHQQQQQPQKTLLTADEKIQQLRQQRDELRQKNSELQSLLLKKDRTIVDLQQSIITTHKEILSGIMKNKVSDLNETM